MREHPPRWAERWIRRRLPPDLEPYLLGDLAEEHAERRRAHGGLRADLWYWWQAATLRPSGLRVAARALNGRWARDTGTPVGRAPSRRARIDMLFQDLRFAVRRLARSPGFTLVAILSLALGIGANTGLFTLIDSIFFQDPGIREPERVVEIFRVAQNPYWSITWNQYRALRDDLPDIFTDLTAYQLRLVRTDATGDEVVSALAISGDYFGVMGVPPATGRAFQPGVETDVDRPSSSVIVSHAFWVRSLGSDPEVLGAELRINARPYTVIGVLPEGFTGKASGLAVDVFVPDPEAVSSPGVDNLVGGGRLAPGVSVERARSELAALAARLNEGRPASLRPVAFTVVPESEVAVHPFLDRAMKPMAALLFAVVGLVLLIACTNLASFLLARAADRRKEFAVRRAMGAGRGRIVRQLLAESLLLGLLGGGAGLLVAYLSLRALLGTASGLQFTEVALNLDVAPDVRVLGFTTMVAVLAGVLFGIIPALTAGREQVAPVLRDESGAVAGARRKVTIRGVLVGAQVALSLVLLVSGGLFLRSLWRATRVDPGFDRDPVAMVSVDPGLSGYDEAAIRRLWDPLMDRARALSGVESVALGTRIPLELGNNRDGIRRPEVEPIPGREYTYPQVARVSEGFFHVLGLDLVAGRGFTADDGPDGPPVVIVNEALARELWPEGGDIVGRTVLLSGRDAAVTVVGVTRTTKVKTLDESPTSYLYEPLRQVPRGEVWLMARADPARARTLPPELRQAAKALDPDLYVHTPTTAAEVAGVVLYLPRMGAILLGIFGALALIMASVGLWGLVSYSVARREKEVGIRLSLGADPPGVVRLMMRGGMRLIVVGMVVGLALSILAGVLLNRFLFGIPGVDVLTLVVVPAVLASVAALASWLPARRAARVDPMTSLRSE